MKSSLKTNIPSKIEWKYGELFGTYLDSFGFLFEDEEGIDYFWWEEGNGACDCSRGRMFGLGEFTCGDTIEILSITPILEETNTQ